MLLNCTKLPHTPPLQLGYLASILEQRNNQVGIVDLNLAQDVIDTAQRALLDFAPDLVGISSTTASFPTAIRIAQLSKEVWPTVKVVMGGCHVTFTANEALGQHPDVDIVVRGEGEETLQELVDCLQAGESLDRVPGLSYRQNGTAIHNPPRPFIQDLDALPWPALHLLDMKSYNAPGALTTSRGCPGRCIFCSASVMSGRRYRVRRPERVVDEMQYLHTKYGFRDLAILDDTFTGLPNKLTLPVCHEIQRRGLEVTFACESRVDNAKPELLKALYAAGCRMIQFGVESGSPQVLEKLGKRITLDQVRRAVQVAVELGIRIVCSFIIGHPFETEQDVQKTVDFMIELRSLGAEGTYLSFLTPFPGTDIYERRESYGITLHETDWTKFVFDKPIISTRHLAQEQLRDLYVEAHMQMLSRIGTTA